MRSAQTVATIEAGARSGFGVPAMIAIPRRPSAPLDILNVSMSSGALSGAVVGFMAAAG